MRLPDELLHRITGGGFRMGPYRGDVRKSDRFPVRRRGILFRVNGEETQGPAIQVLVRELSSTGVGLVSPEPMVPGEEFLLRLPANDGELAIRCQAVRCEQAGNGSRIYTIGAAYRQVVDLAASGDLSRPQATGRWAPNQLRETAHPAAGTQRRTLPGNFSAK
jgi:hypothetical protein